jgi:Fe-S-cluster containining protein
MERHFHCTACGKCCNGWLPLSLDDALAHAGRFPLAMVLTTLRQGARAYDVTAHHGTVMALGKRKHIAVQISPTSYLPSSLSCPALMQDGRCAIHTDKPARCRTMPFSPYREERDQASLLVPKNGWLCDTSRDAPVVYRDKAIVERGDFDIEQQQLVDQSVILREYADGLISSAPNVAAGLESASRKSGGGYVVLNFTTLLPRLTHIDKADFARQQLPVLADFANQTQDNLQLADYHQYYRDNAKGLERFLEGRS